MFFETQCTIQFDCGWDSFKEQTDIWNIIFSLLCCRLFIQWSIISKLNRTLHLQCFHPCKLKPHHTQKQAVQIPTHYYISRCFATVKCFLLQITAKIWVLRGLPINHINQDETEAVRSRPRQRQCFWGRGRPMKYQGSWHEVEASIFSVLRQPRGEASALRTTSLLKPNLKLTHFPPRGPNNSASDLFLMNYGAI